MSFGIFLKNMPRNLTRYPFLTVFAFLFISLNLVLEKTHCKKYFNFLNTIKIRIKIDKYKITIRIPDIIVISDVFLIEEYNPLNITDNSLIFDIGANIGAFCVKTSEDKSQSHIIAIEPSPYNFTFLKQNLTQNRIRNVLPLRLALSNMNGYLEFFIDKANNAASSIFKHNKNMHKLQVKSITLDSLIKLYKLDTLNRKVFIKMDVEGAELNILKGSIKLLKNNNVTILMETHPNILDPSKIKKFLELYNFHVKMLDLSQPFILAQKINK